MTKALPLLQDPPAKSSGTISISAIPVARRRGLATSPVDYRNPRAFSKLDLSKSLPKLSIPRGAISIESALQLRCACQYQTLPREQCHLSPVVKSQYSDLPSGATQLSSGSHSTTAADFLLSYFCLYPIYTFLAASSSSSLICNPPTSPPNTLLL